ncbi:MAG: hypothetical protein ACLQNE_00885 [Thermoguttaceae bacterium]
MSWEKPILFALALAASCCQAASSRTSPRPDNPPPEVAEDWRLQDGLVKDIAYDQAVRRMVREPAVAGTELPAAMATLDKAAAPPRDPRWGALYLRACATRRAARLRTLLERAPQIVFTKHFDMGGSHYAYTEGQSDAQAERHFQPGSSLCLLRMHGLYGQTRTLVDDRGGVIRDPDVSYDGRRVLFAWKKSLDRDDYHLYEMEVAGGAVRQLTFGLGWADYEDAYAPGGQIIFNSTRCVQTVDCWWTEVSNLYTCDGEGRYLRRLGFDQVHSNYPTVTPDGRVLYTRWEYNDRGQIFPQGLFQMNPDGTGQTACYGNNTWFPTTILHARAIPGTQKVVAVFSGHHTIQKGWLGILDPSRGRQENQGAQLIAPMRETKAVRVDAYGQSGDQFQYPYPLSETEFLVAFRPAGAKGPFAIYWMDRDGRRELLAWDRAISCNQPVPLAPRPVPPPRPSTVDYRQEYGTYYLQDIYAGPGLAGVPRGTIKRLRVVALSFRAAGIGANYSQGVAGAALSSTPISIGNGAWDPKTVLGEAKVHGDGSAAFQVPARTPVYFQALDEKGYAVQSMRSWSTSQPGEHVACVGCHESKNSTPRQALPMPTTFSGSKQAIPMPMAFAAGVEQLAGFYGPPRGFSFPKEIQPILDRHCTRCHHLPLDVAAGPRRGRPDAAQRSTVGRIGNPSGHRADLPDGLPIRPTVKPAILPPPLANNAGRPSVATGARSQDRTRTADEPAFSLLGREVVDPVAKRRWSESYLALTRSKAASIVGGPVCFVGHPGDVVNWVDAQSPPTMLPPYFAGAAKSRLMNLLEGGHGGAKVSREELAKLACWIDLAVPYCGDYLEANAWSADEKARYERFRQKRRAMEQIERSNLEAWTAARAASQPRATATP